MNPTGRTKFILGASLRVVTNHARRYYRFPMIVTCRRPDTHALSTGERVSRWTDAGAQDVGILDYH